MSDIRFPLRFGSGARAYNFYKNEVSFRTNFANVRPVTTAVIGISGSIDDFGRGIHITENGNIPITWWTFGDTPEALNAKYDEAMGMVGLGTQRLFIQLNDGEIRWCWAYVNSADITLNVRDVPHKRQMVTANFRVDSPHWEGLDGTLFLNDGYALDDGKLMTGPKIDLLAVEDGDTVEIVNYGSAYTPALVAWNSNGVDEFSNPSLTWYEENGDDIGCQIVYAGTIGVDEEVWIDTRNYTVPFGLRANLTTYHGRWMMIPPGTTTLHVGGTFTGDGGLLSVWIEDWWY
ncbi:MAG: hypothetical protein RLP44_02555 [Aggregatilineales bacterium]